MAMILNRWSLLSAGVVAILCVMLGVNRVPGVKKPEIAENRVLATLPNPPRSLRDLETYREGMDAYVADNFPARTFLIASVNYLRYRLGYSGTARVVVGRDGWLFYDDGNHLPQLRRSNPLAPSDVKAWVSTFAARTETLEAQGIDYLVVSPPVKERVFPERAPAWAAPLDGHADADILAASARRSGFDNLIVLRNAIARQRARHADVYSAYDTHWTGHGAYAGYVELLAALQKAGHPIEPLPLSAFTRIDKAVLSRPQDLAVMLGLASFVYQDFIQFHDPRQDALLRVQYLGARHDWTGDRVIDTGQGGKPVLQIVLDSFSNELMPFLYPHFSRIIASHNQDGFHRADLIAGYKPDIVVVEVLESGLRHSMSPAMSPSPGLAAKLDLALVAPAAEQRQAAPAAVLAPVAPVVAMSALKRIEHLTGIDTSVGTPPNVTYLCNLERLDVGGGLQRDSVLSAAGWFADAENGRVADKVTVVFQSATSSYAAEAQIQDTRSDVAQYFKKPLLSRSGFEIVVPSARLPEGDYDVYLRQNHGTRSLTCITKRVVTIKDGAVVVSQRQ